MEEKETIADICERLRETSDEWDCTELVEKWGFSCGDFANCGECGKRFYASIADRIEAAHEREMATTTPAAIANLANFLGTSGYDTLGNERHKAVCELRNIHTDAGGFVKELAAAIGVEWKAPRVKQTISEIRDRLIHLLGGDAQVDLANLGRPYHEGGAVLDAGVIRECKKPTSETYTGLTLRFPNPAETPDDGDASVTSDARSDTSEAVKKLREFALGEVANFMGPNDAEELLSIARRIEAMEVMEEIDEERRARADEDTREKLEEDIKSTQWCVSLKDVLGWLDRQAAITERNCRAEYDDMRDYLQAQVDRLRGEVEHLNKAPEAYRLANEALREQNMELRRTLDDLHERYANADAVNGLVEHANDCLKAEADRQRDALERCRLAYETVRGLFDGWDGE